MNARAIAPPHGVRHYFFAGDEPKTPEWRVTEFGDRRPPRSIECGGRTNMTDLVFFYGTLMQGFSRPGRTRLETNLRMIGRGWIQAALFDVGIYPAAIPAGEGRVWGEVYEMSQPAAVLGELDTIEGYRPGDPDTSLYTRIEMPVTLEDGRTATAWVYFYNAPLGRAPRIESGDYMEYLKVR